MSHGLLAGPKGRGREPECNIMMVVFVVEEGRGPLVEMGRRPGCIDDFDVRAIVIISIMVNIVTIVIRRPMAATRRGEDRRPGISNIRSPGRCETGLPVLCQRDECIT